MILIADSGSTKTTWCLLDKGNGEKKFIQTRGINPYYQDEDTIISTLKEEFNDKRRKFDSIFFYSAGCANPEINKTARNALYRFFETGHLEVESDLMAAAHALCADNEGIACILGTGSNSCHYNGTRIIESIPPLGFILGDEGSGAVIGKKLLSDILKNQLPGDITQLFFDTFKTNAAEILDHIYKQPFPNRYAAGFTKFISDHISHPSLYALVRNAFDEFLVRNVLQYKKAQTLPVHFTGSIAFYFDRILKESLKYRNLTPGKIIKDPISGLIDYHTRQ